MIEIERDQMVKEIKIAGIELPGPMIGKICISGRSECTNVGVGWRIPDGMYASRGSTNRGRVILR